MGETTARQRKAFRILVVEDTSPLRRLIHHFLKDQGYEVVSMGDSQKAVDQMLQVSPDLAILDVHMPGVDGFTLARILRANSDTAETRIIFMSGSRTEEDGVTAAELGAVAYLEKPFTMEMFLKVVRDQFDLHRPPKGGRGEVLPEGRP